MTQPSPFERSVCDCEECQIPCRTMPGCLIPGDLERILAYVKPEKDLPFIAANFLASEGALVATVAANGQPVATRVPTIVPAVQENGACVFYESGRCSIHEVSPAGCALQDSHHEGHEISVWIVRQQMQSHQTYAWYTEVLEFLATLGQIAEPLSVRKQRLERMFDEHELHRAQSTS